MSALQELSDSLARAVETAGSNIVRVEGRRRLPATGIIWGADGVILTANHVVKGDEVSVGFPDGTSVKATVAGRDPSTDLAVLRAEATGLEPAKRSEELAVGHLVLALGRPGRTVQATLGIISALGDSWRTPMGGQIDRYLQTDVVMYPGFSGGPLVSSSGVVLGLNSSGLARGVSLAVPVATLESTAETLLAHGRMRRGYLGVSTQSARLRGAVKDKLNQETGLLVVNVEPDSPADKGGLVLGDTIVALDGSAVRHHDDLLALLAGDRVDKKVPVSIVRGGEVMSVNVKIEVRE